MRLIKEFNESINYLVEDSKDPKKPNVFIEGVFLQGAPQGGQAGL